MEKPGCAERQYDAIAAEMVCFRLVGVCHAGRRVPCLDWT
jgi:hypothetical protein